MSKLSVLAKIGFAGFVIVFALGWAAAASAQPLRDSAPSDFGSQGLPAAGQSSAARRTEPGYLGLLTDDRQESGKGVRVMEAIPDSPATKAGIKTGDLIVGVDDKAVRTTSDMASVLQAIPPGGTVVFDIDRDGRTQKVNVTLGKRPPVGERRFDNFGTQAEALPGPGGSGSRLGAAEGRTPAAPAPGDAAAGSLRKPLLGVRTQPITPETRARLRLSSDAGALVTQRTVGSPAEKAGIPIDAVIVSVNGAAVASPQELSRLISELGAGREAEIAFVYEGAARRVRVDLTDLSGLAPNPGPAGTPLSGSPDRRAGDGFAPQDEAARIDALERRVDALERRLRDSERGQR